jgi:hypothetical protein
LLTHPLNTYFRWMNEWMNECYSYAGRGKSVKSLLVIRWQALTQRCSLIHHQRHSTQMRNRVPSVIVVFFFFWLKYMKTDRWRNPHHSRNILLLWDLWIGLVIIFSLFGQALYKNDPHMLLQPPTDPPLMTHPPILLAHFVTTGTCSAVVFSGSPNQEMSLRTHLLGFA